MAMAAADAASQPEAASQPTAEAGPAAGDPADAAEVAHAEGLIDEVDGRFKQARERLKEASDLQPQSMEFAFDLARFAWEHGLPSKDEDARRFLAMTPETSEQHLLRAYLLAGAKDKSEAKAAVERAIKLEPVNTEAQQLFQLITQPPGAVPPPRRNWAARARVGVEYDSNVTLIQDAPPSQQAAPRLMLNGGVAWQPTMDNVRLSLGVDMGGGIHLANRTRVDETGATVPNLSTYDFAQILPRFSVDALVGDNRLIGSLQMSQVFLGGFSMHFLQDYSAIAEYRRVIGASWQPGLYASVGYRDFTTGPFNQPGRTDRDGLHTNDGLGLHFVRRDVVAHVRAGFQMENAAGLDQRELGPEADLLLRFNVFHFSFGASIAYMGRFYRQSSTARVDQRVSTGFVATVVLTDYLFIDVDYRFVRNVSTVLPFDYMRHLTSLSVRAAF
jgi:tetratricopeptide (TPR) repeat protein